MSQRKKHEFFDSDKIALNIAIQVVADLELVRHPLWELDSTKQELHRGRHTHVVTFQDHGNRGRQVTVTILLQEADLVNAGRLFKWEAGTVEVSTSHDGRFETGAIRFQWEGKDLPPVVVIEWDFRLSPTLVNEW